jgi:pimeloyl-ACP methyl ester carboxylesterase
LVQGSAGNLATRSWSGNDPAGIFLAHATGFCKEVWDPFVTGVRQGFDGTVVAWDSRGHGGSDAGTPPFDWWDFATDALAVVESIAVGFRVGVGHSMGGAALAMAEILRPGTFAGLVLIEPIVFRPPFGRFDHLLVDIALKRRPGFESVADARANFADKKAFSRWDDRSLDAYVTGGLIEQDGEWLLRCKPEHEAEVFRGGSDHGAYDRLDEIQTPVLLVAGEQSDTHDREFMDDLRSKLPEASVTIVPDAGHFLPMERPGVVADLVTKFLASRDVRGSHDL